MIVCSCEGVGDRKVRGAIAAGARSIDAISERCGAGSRCGGCWPTLERLLADQAAAAAPRRVAFRRASLA